MPSDADSFDIHGSPEVHISIAYDGEIVSQSTGKEKWSLHKGVEVLVSMQISSKNIGDHMVKVSYYRGEEDSALDSAIVYLTSVVVSLDIDANRDGELNRQRVDKASWTWGPEGQGAVLLVNCDRDNASSSAMDGADRIVSGEEDLKDMSRMVLSIQSPTALFSNHKLLLHVSLSDADKLRLFYKFVAVSGSKFKHVLGEEKLYYEVEPASGDETHTFYVEGLKFPSANFSGLVYIGITLLDCSLEGVPGSPLFTDKVVFRVAPWIMTPNILDPVEVFVCRISINPTFLQQLTDLVTNARCRLTICEDIDNRGDRWIQDEMEFGYIEAPHKHFPVVLDSPAQRGLTGFPFKKLLGPDFGYATTHPELNLPVSSLDSFGNLEVSPPVTVNGKEYPLGRIIIGSSFPMLAGRRMIKNVTDFLYAQQVQAPIELFSDWLYVGHVDEFLTFVPAPGKKGFRLLLSSPTSCYQLFQEKQQQGYGDVSIFQGLNVIHRTISEILADDDMKKENIYTQRCIDWNRAILKEQLGLTEKDIIDIPALFTLDKQKYANALFPSLVNMIVLGKNLGIPKPYGPIINGRCCLEEKVSSLLEPLDLRCTFLDDFYSYHEFQGEVHCGTNVLRKPSSYKWWHMIP
ncbi:protein-arginine deiminase type-2 isoform X2 [Microcaecilia unicolor]|nr:protein-arginine deiminase type-2-like isoform X2 [Microcaecilia unicolor]